MKENRGVGRTELINVVHELRHYECDDAFISSHLRVIYKPQDPPQDESRVLAYSPLNYQYGTFFYHGFMQLFESPLIKPFVMDSVAKNHE